MNPNPPHHHDEDDAAFLASLQRHTLRPPPPEWRSEILTAARVSAPASVLWYRSPFWRSMAALWAVLILMALDTWRLTPARTAVSVGNMPVPSPLQSSDLQSLLVSLNDRPTTPRSD